MFMEEQSKRRRRQSSPFLILRRNKHVNGVLLLVRSIILCNTVNYYQYYNKDYQVFHLIPPTCSFSPHDDINSCVYCSL